MHDLSIAMSILDTMTSVAVLEPGERYTEVRLRVGEVAGIEPEALRFGLEVLARDRGWAPLECHIDRLPLRRRCDSCRFEFGVDGYNVRCPRCRQPRTTLIGGDELEIASVEVESVE